MKRTKTKLLKSAIALLLCLSMLVGSTFAWFTDQAGSARNVITSGNLDVKMYWTDDLSSGVWHDVEDDAYNTIFKGENWEPGYTDVKYIKLVNNGDLAFNYKLTLTPQNSVGKLAEVINVYFADHAVNVQSREDLAQLGAIGLLNNVLNGGATADGTLLAADQYSPLHPSGEVILTVAMSMITTAGNDYQNKDSGDFTITALATQAPFEEDAFGPDYDSGAGFPVVLVPDKATAPVTPVDGKVPVGGVSLQGSNISAFVPEGALMESGADKLTLSVTPMKSTTSDITVVNDEILIPVDVHIDGLAANNTVPIIIDLGEVLPKNLNMGNYHLFHVENGTNVVMTHVASAAELTAHNRFTYDPLTGAVTVAMATFSEVALVAETSAQWEGKYAEGFNGGNGSKETPYLIANADQLAYLGECISNENDAYGSAYYKLMADLNLGGSSQIFYPIGYHKVGNPVATVDLDEVPEAIYEISEDAQAVSPMAEAGDGTWYTYGGSFKGIFDGNGHTIRNFYQNTWAMRGNYDGNYWNAAMGLFGYVNGGTVKNLTVDNFTSDGEFTPTGVIAAYAAGDAKFENIAITNCNPRVYNTGNGGIIGIAGSTSAVNDDHITLTNITVDNSNKISALWGSYDVACGGLVGMYRGNVDASGNATGDTISFTNCHVAAQMDVYNDVCGNYQYYWYRYCGMIIGSVRHNKTEGNYTVPNMAGISAGGCTVHFGNWNDYYYCEFEKNGHPSYSGPDDYKFSRVDKSEIVFDGNGKATGCTHEHTAKENNQAIHLPFDQLFTGYGWGVKSQGIKELAGITILDIQLGNQEESVEKFETKFTGDFLYRVGNKNAVPVGNLFAAKAGAAINNSGVWVTVEKLDDSMQVSGNFTANTSDWTKGTIQFSGTGIVKVTIQDYNFCTPTELIVEVIDATNATSATSATASDVVLLQNCGFSSLEVSGGHTLYGNGFTLSCSSDSYATDRTYSFVELKGGTLDNVRIVVPNFSHAIMYETNKTENGNPSNTDANGKVRYYNVRSAVLVSKSSTIANSYISGGRAAIYATSGALTIENSTIFGGAVANIQAEASSSLNLKDVTLIQKPIAANVHDTSKTLMGLSIVTMCDTAGVGAAITLEGYFHQYAWANSDYKNYVPSDAQDVVTEVLGKQEFVHSITYDDGVTRDSVNLGIAYMPNGITATKTDNLTDSRSTSEREKIPYEKTSVKTIAAIYTYKSTNGTDAGVADEPTYNPTTQGNVVPDVSYTDTNEHRIFTTTYDESKSQWKSTLKIDVDAGAYDFSFAKLLVQKHGVELPYTVETADGVSVDKNAVINLNSAVANVYILKVTDNQIYDKNGNNTGTAVETTYVFELLSTKTSLPAPTWTSKTLNGTPYIVVDSKNSDWNCAVPVLDGLKVKYWSKKQNKEIELDLANVVSAAGLSAGLQNGSNNTITIHVADEYTLQITTTGFKTNDNGKPVVVGGKLYFTVSSSSNYVSTNTTDRTISITYSFTDANNSEPISLSTSFSVVYANHKSNQYKYSDFCNGKLTAASSSICVTPDTLVTLADGSKKQIQDVQVGDSVIAWNFYSGKYESVPVTLLQTHGTGVQDVLKLRFEDGTELKILGEHGVYDADLDTFVFIDKDDVSSYIGHSFVKQDGDSFKTVKLVDYAVYAEYTTAYTILSLEHYNVMLEGMFTVTPAHVGDNFFNPFQVGEDMKYDAAAVQADIEKYGLYTYEDFDHVLTYEQFVALNLGHFKVSVGKGYVTYDGLIYLIEAFINNKDLNA